MGRAKEMMLLEEEKIAAIEHEKELLQSQQDEADIRQEEYDNDQLLISQQATKIEQLQKEIAELKKANFNQGVFE
jgi:hypothetical protein